MTEVPNCRAPLTVLLSSAGRRVGLLRALRESALALGADVRLIASDMAPEMSAACRLADTRYRVPAAHDPDFVPVVLDLIRRHEPSLIIPTIDTELPAYAAARADFEAIGAWVNIGDPLSIAVCRDKDSTAATLRAHGVEVPETQDLEAARAFMGETATTDLVVKPRSGSAGRSISVVQQGAALPPPGIEPMLAQERLFGAEYTVNVFVDRLGTVRSAVPHQRLAVRSGEVEKGITVRDPRLTDLARRVASALPGLTGVFCFQVIDDARRGPVVFEVNARFGGGYPLAHAAGGEFTRWLLEERLGAASTAHDDWRAGVSMLRFDDAVFLRPDA